MPVFVVREHRPAATAAYCNFYEGESRHRLNYGSYNDEVRAGLDFLRDELAPVLREVIRASGGIPLKPLIGRALRMGDELHSRNTAATTLFDPGADPAVPRVRGAMCRSERALTALRFFFAQRLLVPAAVDGRGEGDGRRGQGRRRPSSVVTAMTISCRNFAIRVSGLGDEWFLGPLPEASTRAVRRVHRRRRASGSAGRATSPRPSGSAASPRRRPSGCRPTRAARRRRWSG